MRRNFAFLYVALLLRFGFTAFINSSQIFSTKNLSSTQIKKASKYIQLENPQTINKIDNKIGFTSIATLDPKQIFLNISKIQIINGKSSFNQKFHANISGKYPVWPVWEVKFQEFQELKRPGSYLPSNEKSRIFRRDEFTELETRVSNLEIIVIHLLNDSGIPEFNWMLMRVTIEEIARLSKIPFPNYDPDINRLKPRIEKLRQDMQIVFDANYRNMPC